jgi:GNAT superfamily N-acetyltransferase
MHAITLSDATNVDPSALADIRVEAMRPSLEAVGRFDPERARNRFLETYDAHDTRVVWSGEDLIGFYVVRLRSDHLYLDHIYIRPDHQGGGLGRRIVRSVQDRAREAGLPLRLMALRDSPANAFYISLGFGLESSDALDNYYTWNAD